jgi:hypothetical protein
MSPTAFSGPVPMPQLRLCPAPLSWTSTSWPRWEGSRRSAYEEARLTGGVRRMGGGVALLRPLAEVTLDAVGALMQRGGKEVALVLEDVRRFRKGGDDGVVVLVEAMVDGRKTLSSGAAFSVDSLERASVVAVLQATNAFVAGGAPAGVPEIQPYPVSRTSQPPHPQTGSAALRDPSPEKPSDSPKASTPNDYVSEVLSRLQSGTSRRPGWTAPGLPEPD